MEFSFYGWAWMVFGAVFGPVEVIAYTASIVKVFIDRSRIRKLNIIRREARLKGPPRGKRPNIQIVNDEERAMRVMNRIQQEKINSSLINASSSTNGELDNAKSTDHKKHGGHNVQVTVEHNIMVLSVNEQHDVLRNNSTGVRDVQNSSNDVSGTDKQSLVIEMNNTQQKPGTEISNSEFLKEQQDSHSVLSVNNSSTQLPAVSVHRRKKEPPPKPKRNQLPANHNKSAHQSNTESTVISKGGSFASVNGSLISVSFKSINEKLHLISQDTNRRFSFVSVTDTSNNQKHVPPARSFSEDNLHNSSCAPDFGGKKAGKGTNSLITGHINGGFLQNVEEI